MILVTYKKTLRTIEKYLAKSPEIFVINSMSFALTLAIAHGNKVEKLKLESFTFTDISIVVPNILELLREAQKSVEVDDIYKGRLFPLEFVTSHGFSWVSTSSKIYESTLQFETNSSMDDWQKFIRASTSSSKSELAYLALDANNKIRERASKRLLEL